VALGLDVGGALREGSGTQHARGSIVTTTIAAPVSQARRILVVIGSRPEAIKLAPVVFELRRRRLETVLCGTGQQRDLIPQALAEFDLEADVDLAVMEANQSLAGLTSRLLVALDRTIADTRPDWILVQGDTTSAMAGALAGFYRGVRVGHVEAGMRTGDRGAPFPEEVNRRIITQCASLHFAPTAACADHLRADGVPPSQIVLAGNTVVDALLWTRARSAFEPPPLSEAFEIANGRRIVLVTSHRREHFGVRLANICAALRAIVDRVPDALVVYPVHPNPNVRTVVSRLLAGHPRILLVDPLPYRSFIALMDRSYLILTDSGGLQEEAPSLSKPVLVLRSVTERVEGIEAGTAVLVGLNTAIIADTAVRLMTDRAEYERMAGARNPYGDGRAAARIVDAIEPPSATRAARPVFADTRYL
jgi:UDP-N-acetylglucosamine 2-epimerase